MAAADVMANLKIRVFPSFLKSNLHWFLNFFYRFHLRDVFFEALLIESGMWCQKCF